MGKIYAVEVESRRTFFKNYKLALDFAWIELLKTDEFSNAKIYIADDTGEFLRFATLHNEGNPKRVLTKK